MIAIGTPRHAAALALAVALSANADAVQAQSLARHTEPQFGAQIIAVRQDDRVSGAWSPGIGFTARVPLFRAMAAQVSFSDVRTRRWEEIACPAMGSCPAPRKVSGGSTTVTASLGADLRFGDYGGFTGVGYGRVWDSQPGRMTTYGGPTWVWDIGVQRMLRPALGVEFGYRLLRVSWDNGYTSILQGIHMTYHCFAVGVTYAPWAGSGS